MPLHSSLGDRGRPHLKEKTEQKSRKGALEARKEHLCEELKEDKMQTGIGNRIFQLE